MLVVALAVSPLGAAAQVSTTANDIGPRFRADGFMAEAYGMRVGYPSCKQLEYIDDKRCRVGAFSHFDTLFPARTIAPAKEASKFDRAAREASLRYSFAGKEWTIDDYLNRFPITGLLIAKGNTILLERYQYGRNDSHRMTSFSMAKTIVGLLVGIAISEGAIRSIDDRAETYVPGLAGTEYGLTPIKALLEMRSGVKFNEDYADQTSDIYTLGRAVLEQGAGSLATVKRFNSRGAAPGEVFSYSSAETVVLGLVLVAATGRTVADYASEKIWKRIGTEAAASWIIDATGQEITFAYVNAVLRDWARLGLMIAHDGSWSGQSVVPAAWLAESRENSAKTVSPLLRYGYQIWVSADLKRCALRGLRGQWVLVDPQTKLVMVQTSLSNDGLQDDEMATMWTAARAHLQ
jgi:CubicO group peptidase (beta-lactamase class C family)